MATSICFNRKQFNYLREALEIAEILAGEHYNISPLEWKRYPYDIRTLRQLRDGEVTDKGFAQLAKYSLEEGYPSRKNTIHEFYRVCVQDHVILQALQRKEDISLNPLLLYIVTHELIHIIRFSRYLQDYFAQGHRKEQEEKEVHSITYELLKNIPFDGIQEVVNAYQWARAGASA